MHSCFPIRPCHPPGKGLSRLAASMCPAAALWWLCLLLGGFLPESCVLPQAGLVLGRPVPGCCAGFPGLLSLHIGPCFLDPSLLCLGSLLVLLKVGLWMAKKHYVV